MVDSPGSTAHLFSLVASSIACAQEKLVKIGVRTSLQICSSSNREIEGEALCPHCILTLAHVTHCAPRGMLGYRGQLQSGLGLVIAAIATTAILRSRCNQLTVVTYHVSTTRLARVPLPRVALHGIGPKAKLRGLGTILGIRGVLDSLGRHSIDSPPLITSHTISTYL